LPPAPPLISDTMKGRSASMIFPPRISVVC
jgi:hypothetical protein